VCAGFKHVSLEMGGKNIIIVMDDANLDWRWMARLGGFGTSGQRCTAASRWRSQSVYGEFAKRLVERVKSLKLQRLDTPVEMAMHQRTTTQYGNVYVEIGKNEGAKLLTGGTGWILVPSEGCSMSRRFSAIAREDGVGRKKFGPVVSLIAINDLRKRSRLRMACRMDFGFDLHEDVNQGVRSDADIILASYT